MKPKKCPLHEPEMSCDPTFFKIPIGNQHSFFQCGNYLNALDDLTGKFRGLSEEGAGMYIEALRLYADHLENNN